MSRLLTSGALLVIFLAGCQWREGNYVWVERFDASPGDAGDGGCVPTDDGGLVAAGQVTAEGLLSLVESNAPGLAVVDLRAPGLYQVSHVPGAISIPWAEGAFDGALTPLDDATDVVVYDIGGGQDATDAAAALRPTCERPVSVLIDGFTGWGEWDFPVESP